MKYVDLGKAGLNVSAVAVGCMRISALSHGELSRFIHTALDCGVNFFDHADIYGGGECEAAFGRVLKEESGLRGQMVLQGKCGIRKGMYDFSKEHILKSVDEILSRLNTDYLDVLLLHRPDALMEPEEVGEAFDRLEAAGKVKRFGVSNFNARQTDLLQSGLRQKLVANQLQFGLMHTGMIDHALCANTKFPGSPDRDGEVLDYCRLHGLTVQAWSPFQYGFFEGVFLGNEKFPELNAQLSELSGKYNVSEQALAAAWILRHPAGMQVISGSTNPERLKDICTACDVELSREDWYALYLAAGNQLP